ncbi:MAG TPA: hypothetical protein VLL72_10350 [Kiloniellales bacterium]|nr:hypothetical protein [Kiloniellales bacterium]
MAERHPERAFDDPPRTPNRELSFDDLLDLVNPLQHIPIVSTVYRALTGDAIEGPARILGGFLYGGPFGFLASIADTLFAQATGRDVGATVVAALTGDETPQAPGDFAVAAAEPEPSAEPADGPPPLVTAAGPGSDEKLGRESEPVVTGPAALAALAADLRVGAVPAEPMGPEKKDATDEGEAATAERAHPDLPAWALTPRRTTTAGPGTAFVGESGAAFPARMLEALDRYQAMTRIRHGLQDSGLRPLDREF